MIDEPLIMPVSPGAALVRLAQVGGALRRHEELARRLPPDAAARLQQAREALLVAIEMEDQSAIARALDHARNLLGELYATVGQLNGQAGAAPQTGDLYNALGFPDPAQRAIQAINPGSVQAAFSKPHRQVLTTLSFQDAAGATAYWLREIRVLNGERMVDHTLESNAPIFTRLRLPPGTHVFEIESRNASEWAVSAEFTVEVPDLQN